MLDKQDALALLLNLAPLGSLKTNKDKANALPARPNAVSDMKRDCAVELVACSDSVLNVTVLFNNCVDNIVVQSNANALPNFADHALQTNIRPGSRVFVSTLTVMMPLL